jgi:hypothetical protein
VVVGLAKILRDGLSHDLQHGPRVTKLYSLVASLPLLEMPGAGEDAR